jgi:hypothetical protein
MREGQMALKDKVKRIWPVLDLLTEQIKALDAVDDGDELDPKKVRPILRKISNISARISRLAAVNAAKKD